jgi:hypothetical protein
MTHNADYVRHVRIYAQWPEHFDEALRTQEQDGFALERVVPHTTMDYIAVFLKVSPNGSSGTDGQ